jgi:acetyl-CoA acetyltransferase
MFPITTRADMTELPGYMAAEALYRNAGIGPDEIDIAQIYDCFTISLLLQLEAYGFCERGEGGALAQSGELFHDGRMPINTAGGNMSEGYIHGMNHVVEAVRQLRGTATNQIKDAEVCLVTSGPLPTASAAILRKAA